jgi:hypothetical protein
MANRFKNLDISWVIHFLTLMHASLFFVYQDIVSIIVFVIATLIRYSYLRKYKDEKLGLFFFMAHTDLTFSFLPLLSYTGPYLAEYVDQMHLVVNIGLLACSLFYLAATGLPSSSKNKEMPIKLVVGHPVALIFFMGAFTISLLSYKMGIGVMGENEKIYPFKIVGLINVIRSYIIPYCFILLLEFYTRTRKYGYLLASIAIFVVWCLVESYLKLSRGVIIRNMIPVFCWLYYHRYFDLKKLKLMIISVSLFFVILFPVSISLRLTLTENKNADLSYVLNDIRQRFKWDSNIYYMFQRLFPDGIEILKYRTRINDSMMSNNMNRFLNFRGNAKFHTSVIDMSPVYMKNRHSSGIGGLSDGYFLFGIPGLLLSMTIFFFFFALWDAIESDIVLKSISIVAILDSLIGTILLRFVVPSLITGHIIGMKYLRIKRNII